MRLTNYVRYTSLICLSGLISGCGSGFLPVLTGTGGFIAGSGGQDGADGGDGVSCWQWAEYPTCDLNDDGTCDVFDCLGVPGPAGADGVDGIDGQDGVDGIDGQDGETGPQGEPGPQGPSGEDRPHDNGQHNGPPDDRP